MVFVISKHSVKLFTNLQVELLNKMHVFIYARASTCIHSNFIHAYTFTYASACTNEFTQLRLHAASTQITDTTHTKHTPFRTHQRFHRFTLVVSINRYTLQTLSHESVYTRACIHIHNQIQNCRALTTFQSQKLTRVTSLSRTS